MSEGALGFNAISLTLAGLLTTAATIVLLLTQGIGKVPERIVIFEEEAGEHSIAPLYTTPADAPSPTTGMPFYPPDTPFLYDLQNFNYIIEPTVCTSDLLGVMLVNSDLSHVKLRNAQRYVYPDALLSSLGLRRVFLLGSPKEKEKQAAIDDESRSFKDILQGNFIDAYRNLTYKTTMGLLWAYKKCMNANFVIKVDDDIAVDVFRLSERLRDELKIGVWRMSGPVLANAHPIRDTASEWYLTKEEYPGDTFPDFLIRWIYYGPTVMFGELAEYASKNIPYLYLEDVVLTGMAKDKLFTNKSVLHDIVYNFAKHPKDLDCCMSKPNVQCFYFAGRVDGDDGVFRMERYLRHALKCSDPNACAPAVDPAHLNC